MTNLCSHLPAAVLTGQSARGLSELLETSVPNPSTNLLYKKELFAGSMRLNYKHTVLK